MTDWYKICPYCGEEIRKIAKKCRFCWEFLENEDNMTIIKRKRYWLIDFITGTSLNRIWRVKFFARSIICSLITIICSAIIILIFNKFNWAESENLLQNIIWAIAILFIFCSSIWWNICLNNKRLHDIWWSWWSQLLLLIPVINVIFAICMRFVPWNKFSNEYGEPSESSTREIVFIDIFIWLLIIFLLRELLRPRMQWAQGRARDVSRETALSQIQSAIVTYQSDYGKWPWMDRAKNWIPVSEIQSELISAGMTSVPSDPLPSKIFWLWNPMTEWEYLYMVSKYKWKDDAWFILMAKTEVSWWSNWVICENGEWYIKKQTDLADIQLCNTVSEWSACSNSNWVCVYTSADQLRYIIIY